MKVYPFRPPVNHMPTFGASKVVGELTKVDVVPVYYFSLSWFQRIAEKFIPPFRSLNSANDVLERLSKSENGLYIKIGDKFKPVPSSCSSFGGREFGNISNDDLAKISEIIYKKRPHVLCYSVESIKSYQRDKRSTGLFPSEILGFCSEKYPNLRQVICVKDDSVDILTLPKNPTDKAKLIEELERLWNPEQGSYLDFIDRTYFANEVYELSREMVEKAKSPDFSLCKVGINCLKEIGWQSEKKCRF